MAKKPRNNPSLEALRAVLSDLERAASDLKGVSASQTRKQVDEGLFRLKVLAASLDPVRAPKNIFDPGNPETVGRFVGIALLAQTRHPLGNLDRFYGSGVYALYYHGEFPSYKALVGTENPIYVGKADPATPNAQGPPQQGERLCARLGEHAKAVQSARTTLDIKDFSCKWLVVTSGLQIAAEAYLIQLFKPIWNWEMNLAFGIGKHGDASKTRANKRSPWDTLHPGRRWAQDLMIPDQKPTSQIIKELADHFERHPPLRSIDSVLHEFYEGLRQR